MEKWFKSNTERLDGKKVAMTGATGGLGVWWCRYLLRLGADLILINRNSQKAEALKKTLCSEFDDAVITLVTADMENIDDVENACGQLEQIGFDILILNAGAYAIPRHKTAVGYDNVFQIDFASPYYMVRRLLPYMQSVHAHVVAVGSIAHNYSESDPGDYDFSTRTASNKVYGNAKRYLMFALYEWFKNQHDVTLSVVHPGISFTGITDHYPKWLFFFIKHPMKVIFMRPKRAALCLLRGVFEPTGYMEWIGPRLFDVWGLPVKRKLRTCTKSESGQIALRAEEIYQKCVQKKTVG